MAVIPNPFTGAASQVVFPSGDATGVKDAAALLAAVAKLPANGGGVTMSPSANWSINCGAVSINRSNVWIDATGCYILAVGAGDVFRMFDSSAYNPRLTSGGGLVGFPTIDGTNTTGNSCALHLGDILNARVDVHATNFLAGTTSKGVWLDNQWFQTEQALVRVHYQSCRTGVMFDNSTGTSLSASATGSFDRLVADIFCENNGAGDGVTWNNGAQSIGQRLGIYGNFSTSATAYSVLLITGSNAGGSSNLANGYLYIDTELDSTGSTNPTTIKFGAGGNTVFKCEGYVNFSGAGGFTSSNNAGQFLFTGPVFGDSNLSGLVSLGSATFVQGISGNGQTIFTAYLQQNKLTGGGGFTGEIMSPGAFDGQTITLINPGAGTLTFAAAGTSHVAQGVAAVLAANVPRTFTWVAADSLWY